MKIAFIVGTRPEIIKMSPLIDEVEKRGIDYILIHTGQHYDNEMSQQFFKDLEIPLPDYNIGVGSTTHGKQTAIMLEGIEEILLSEKPDIALVEGDTNAVVAGAIASSKLHLPVGHVEAGLRSFDKTMPEELNRMIADACSNLYFVPTKESAINLLFEGFNPHDIHITGNTVVDACLRNLKIARKNSDLLSKIDLSKDILTLTIHRAENVDDPIRLANIVDALLELSDYTIIFPVHPRTRKNLIKSGLYESLENAGHVKMINPIGYLDFLILLSNSKLVMTDSGGIQEEAITLNIPCVTLRYNTERPETVTAGGNILVGTGNDVIVNTIKDILNNSETYRMMSESVNPYGDGTSSQKIVDIILKSHGMGELSIKPPEVFINHNGWHLQRINEDISVTDFEEENKNSFVRLVFNEDGGVEYPQTSLSLKNKTVITIQFENI